MVHCDAMSYDYFVMKRQNCIILFNLISRSLETVNRVGVPSGPTQQSPINQRPSTHQSPLNQRPSTSQAARNHEQPSSSTANGGAVLSVAAAAASRRLDFASNQVANLRSNRAEKSRRGGNQVASSHCMQRSASSKLKSDLVMSRE